MAARDEGSNNTLLWVAGALGVAYWLYSNGYLSGLTTTAATSTTTSAPVFDPTTGQYVDPTTGQPVPMNAYGQPLSNNSGYGQSNAYPWRNPQTGQWSRRARGARPTVQSSLTGQGVYYQNGFAYDASGQPIAQTF